MFPLPPGTQPPEPSIEQVTELPRGGLWVQPEWSERFPWLCQGTTGRTSGAYGGDFAIFREGARAGTMQRWRAFAASLGFGGAVHSRQVHGRTVLVHRSVPDGISLTAEADGHVTGEPRVLMGITVADCVPVFMVDGARRVPALLHAGWRGVASGILEAGVHLLRTGFGSDAKDLHVHLGPSICGRCYQVGHEVHRALGLAEARDRTPVDLRRILALKSVALGVPPRQVSLSSFCTLCEDSPFFSHRGGDPERQVGFMGIRD